MYKRIATLLALLIPGTVLAASADLSGVYQCTGHDAKEGEYHATLTLTADAAQAADGFTGYQLKMDAPGYGLYLGSVVAKGDSLAITFTSTDPASKDYGTGLGTVKHWPDGAVSFNKYYYEPVFKGGDHGSESCLRRGS